MELTKLANTLKILGDPTRLKMISLLNTRDCCVCEIVPILGISQPAISQHMSKLKSCNLVTETRKGQWIVYSLNRERLNEIGLALNQLPDQAEEFSKLQQQGLLVHCN